MTAVKRSGRACPVTAGLDREFQSIAAAESGPAWIGYAVRAVSGEHHMCCYSSFEDGAGNRCCRGCGLEGVRGITSTAAAAPGPVQLEASGEIFVLLRIESHVLD